MTKHEKLGKQTNKQTNKDLGTPFFGGERNLFSGCYNQILLFETQQSMMSIVHMEGKT